ncbi:TetR/AcrR family transcriptional regulator [Nocardia vinacea]|uniref:TetR/AcrR family transcriptional regulator n=1 Tax=Nocardia vinacea TaxID=96468 RepID=UPI00341D8A4D
MTEMLNHLSPCHRRSRLLAAASEVFVLRGYHSASIREISHRAGVTKPIIYKHFSGKLDLYLAVLQNHLDELVTGVQRALHSTTDNRARALAAVQAYFDFVDQESQGFRLIFESNVVTEPSVQLRLNQTTEACVDALFGTLAEDPRLGPPHARILAVGLVGASEFAARYWLDVGRPISKAEAVDTVFSLCWGGLSEVPLRPVD